MLDGSSSNWSLTQGALAKTLNTDAFNILSGFSAAALTWDGHGTKCVMQHTCLHG
jgi:hypothetical protein